MSERETLRTSDFADRRGGDAETGRGEQRDRPSSSAAMTADQEAAAALLTSDDTARFDDRWQEIQASFVDEPRHAVEQADALVAELMQQLASGFADTRSRLESQWSSGGEGSTEDLRIALTRYRSFFKRLLSA